MLDRSSHEFQTCYLEEVAQRSRPPRLTAIENLALETLISGTKQNVPQGFLHLEQWRVLSDQFELVSAWTVELSFTPRQPGATQREQRCG